MVRDGEESGDQRLEDGVKAVKVKERAEREDGENTRDPRTW